MDKLKFLRQGENGLVVEFGNEIDPYINTLVHSLARNVASEYADLIEAVVPTYRSFLIFFDPLVITRKELIEKIKNTAAALQAVSLDSGTTRTVIIPTLYGGEVGSDIEFVATYNQLTIDEVIKIHTSTPYRIYMMGFTPGFPYLGGMSDKIATPRLKTPRTKIPTGSVGIAGAQTGLYPIESPGGWQLIGRTPLKVFNPESKAPFIYAAGDFLQFESISTEEYARIQKEVELGIYILRTFLNKETGR
jgi:inhibitor of KinA